MQKSVIGKSFFDYLIYLPKDYNEKKKYPLILFLHGAGERANGQGNLDMLKLHGLPKLCETMDFDAIILSPQCKQDLVWVSFTIQLKQLIDEIIEQYSVDEKAISITGLSMGGFGSFQMLMDFPKLFSGAVVICGGGMEWRASTIVDIPIRIFHGEQDTIVLPSHSKQMYSALVANGAKDVELVLYPDGDHGIWGRVYETTDSINWLITRRNNRSQVCRLNYKEPKNLFDWKNFINNKSSMIFICSFLFCFFKLFCFF